MVGTENLVGTKKSHTIIVRKKILDPSLYIHSYIGITPDNPQIRMEWQPQIRKFCGLSEKWPSEKPIFCVKTRLISKYLYYLILI